MMQSKHRLLANISLDASKNQSQVNWRIDKLVRALLFTITDVI